MSRSTPAKVLFNEHSRTTFEEGPCLYAFMIFVMSAAIVLELVEGQNHSLVKTVKTHIMLQPFDWIPTFDVQGHVTLGVLLSANTLQVSFVDSAGVIQPRASLGI